MLPAYIQTSTIILWTELFPKKRREKIQGEILQSIFEYSGVSTFLQELQDSFEYSVFYSVSTRNPASFQSSRAILHTELILLQELQGSSRAGSFQQLFPVSQAFYTAEQGSRTSLQHSKAIQHKQASSNSTR